MNKLHLHANLRACMLATLPHPLPQVKKTRLRTGEKEEEEGEEKGTFHRFQRDSIGEDPPPLTPLSPSL